MVEIMRRLIAIVSCHHYRSRADVLRDTWAKIASSSFDVRFFLGGGQPERDDEVIIDAPDDYKSLRLKTQKVFSWAYAQGYNHIFKTDDDVYVIPKRLMDAFIMRDYVGRVRGPSRENVAPQIYGPGESSFCSGFGYWLSQGAAKIVAEAKDNGDWAEDRFVGNVLAQRGIRPIHDPNIMLWPPLTGHFCHLSNDHCISCRRQYQTASVICPYAKPGVISEMHKRYIETGVIPTWL